MCVCVGVGVCVCVCVCVCVPDRVRKISSLRKGKIFVNKSKTRKTGNIVHKHYQKVYTVLQVSSREIHLQVDSYIKKFGLSVCKI
jgi:hypothetical protein